MATSTLTRRNLIPIATAAVAVAALLLPALADNPDAELLGLCRKIEDLAVQERDVGGQWESAFDAVQIEVRRQMVGRSLSDDEIGNVFEALSRDLAEDKLGEVHAAIWDQIDALYQQAAQITPHTLVELAAFALATARSGSPAPWGQAAR